MKKLILIAFTALLLTSCGVSKKKAFYDKSTKDTTIDRTTIIRPGDTITIDIPNVRYKDTIIRRTNYENKTVASVYYDKYGNQRFECQSAEIREMRELISEVILNDIKSKDESKSEFNPQYFIYALAVLAVVVVIGFVLISVMIMKIKASILSPLK